MQMDMLQCSMIFLLIKCFDSKKEVGKSSTIWGPKCGDFVKPTPLPEHSVVGYTVVKVDGATKGSDL